MQYDLKTIQRFYSKIDFDGAIAPGMTTPCWEWTAYRNKGGYGIFFWNSRDSVAHRFAYELLVGPIPEGLQIDHACHTRHCVNPQHLSAVTPKVNMERRKGAHRNNQSSGIRGVSLDKRANKWHAYAKHNGKKHHGGIFTDLAEAEQAAITLRSRLYGADPIRREELVAV
jgi:hypothetical protein